MKDEYKIGKCLICGLVKALKNDICAECENSKPLEFDSFNDIFKEFGIDGDRIIGTPKDPQEPYIEK